MTSPSLSNTGRQSILENMIIFFQKRSIINEVAEGRWREFKEDDKFPVDSEDRKELIAKRKIEGVERDLLEEYLIDDQYQSNTKGLHRLLQFIHVFFLPKKKRAWFYVKINDLLEECVELGYIKSTGENEEERLLVTPKGRSYVSFYENKHIQQAITVIIQWGIPALIIWLLSNLFNISLK